MNLITKLRLWQKITLAICTILLILVIAGGITVYTLSPRNIAYPIADHLHFRLQLIIDGKAEDFSQDKYQISYIKGICGAPLTDEPIHFHDFRDQIVHIHWRGMTGGQVLKYYGWNKIGGPDDLMGFRLDTLQKWIPEIRPIPIFRDAIPDVAPDTNVWIYTGDKSENGEITYRKRDMEAFLWADLESFFGKQSIIRQQQERAAEEEKKLNFSPFAPLIVSAHDGHDHSEEIGKPLIEVEGNRLFQLQSSQSGDNSSLPTTNEPSKLELEKINNLLGNVVIFVQKEEPNETQIRQRFENLAPLDNSSCGG